MMNEEYSYCESAHASSRSVWHLRRLTRAGRKPGGGADTPALCGRVVAWDLEMPVEPHRLAACLCAVCVREMNANGVREG